MNVWLLQTGETLPVRPGVRKMRTALLADALVERGHQVTWWASTFDHWSLTMLWPKDTEVQVGSSLAIKALRGGSYRKNVSLKRYWGYRRIARKFQERAQDESPPDVILASLPDHLTAFEALAYARKRNIPIIVDLRDQWPDIFVDAVPALLRPMARTFLRRDFEMVKRIVAEADALTSMMTQILDWAQSKAPRPSYGREKVFFLGARRLEIPSSIPQKITSIADECRGRCVVTFIGTFGKYCNPTVIAKAARRLQDLPEIAFVIAGHGDYYKEVFQASQGLPNVFMPGWLNEEEMAALLSFSNIGVLPLSESRDAFPNKAFSYMSGGLPIITSVDGDLTVLLQKEEIGYYFPPNDDERLAELIRGVASDRALWEIMREKVLRLFEARFEAGQVYPEFATFIENVVRERPIR